MKNVFISKISIEKNIKALLIYVGSNKMKFPLSELIRSNFNTHFFKDYMMVEPTDWLVCPFNFNCSFV